MVCTLALDARQTLKMWQPLALLFHIMNLDLLWVRKRCLNISAIGGDILSLSLDFWPFRWMFGPKMIFPKYACLSPPKSWWLLWQGCFGDFFGGEETFYVWPIACIKEIQMCYYLWNHSQTSHQHFNTEPPGLAGRPLGQWSFLQIFCAGAQRSKLVFANGLPITLGMNEATSPNTTRVTLATATRGTGIKMAI